MLEKLQSFRDTLNVSYVRPSVEDVNNYEKNLSSNVVALDYLKNVRGLSDKTIKHFRLGYDVSKNAISIPVYKNNELVNIRYRYIDPESKQRYSQLKGCEIWLYNDDGLSKAKETGQLLIVEGEFDLMSAWQVGFKSIVSPASGKDSYGTWIEMLDTIPKVYIAYDNDNPGKKASIKLAERIGSDKCFEVAYAEDVKDANDFFKKYTQQDFLERIKSARPYYKYDFSGVTDIISNIRGDGSKTFYLDSLPLLNWNDIHVLIVSGSSGAGKTSSALNVASELADKKIPTVIFPFERGIETAGKRFIQIRYGIKTDEFEFTSDKKWNEIVDESINLPLFFSKPQKEDMVGIIRRAQRIFGARFFIIDHLDYLTHGQNQLEQQKEVMYMIEELAQELDIKFIVVHHINKTDGTGLSSNRKPNKEMLSGASEIYKIPEAVVFVYRKDKDQDFVEFIIDKNKGLERNFFFTFEQNTGRMKLTDKKPEDTKSDIDKAFENF